MPDISMCGHESCPMRSKCYRNPASGTEPSDWRQAWMDFKPDTNGHCVSFWPSRIVDYEPGEPEQELSAPGGGNG